MRPVISKNGGFLEGPTMSKTHSEKIITNQVRDTWIAVFATGGHSIAPKTTSANAASASP